MVNPYYCIIPKDRVLVSHQYFVGKIIDSTRKLSVKWKLVAFLIGSYKVWVRKLVNFIDKMRFYIKRRILNPSFVEKCLKDSLCVAVMCWVVTSVVWFTGMYLLQGTVWRRGTEGCWHQQLCAGRGLLPLGWLPGRGWRPQGAARVPRGGRAGACVIKVGVILPALSSCGRGRSLYTLSQPPYARLGCVCTSPGRFSHRLVTPQ